MRRVGGELNPAMGGFRCIRIQPEYVFRLLSTAAARTYHPARTLVNAELPRREVIEASPARPPLDGEAFFLPLTCIRIQRGAPRPAANVPAHANRREPATRMRLPLVGFRGAVVGPRTRGHARRGASRSPACGAQESGVA